MAVPTKTATICRMYTALHMSIKVPLKSPECLVWYRSLWHIVWDWSGLCVNMYKVLMIQILSFTSRMPLLIWSIAGEYGNKKKKVACWAEGIHKRDFKLTAWGFHVYKLHRVDKCMYSNSLCFYSQLKNKKNEDYHAERLLFIAPYSVCSIRKVKIHDFYFQGGKSIPGSSKQTVVWMYYWFHIHTSAF